MAKNQHIEVAKIQTPPRSPEFRAKVGQGQHQHVPKEVFLEFVQDLGQSPRNLASKKNESIFEWGERTKDDNKGRNQTWSVEMHVFFWVIDLNKYIFIGWIVNRTSIFWGKTITTP